MTFIRDPISAACFWASRWSSSSARSLRHVMGTTPRGHPDGMTRSEAAPRCRRRRADRGVARRREAGASAGRGRGDGAQAVSRRRRSVRRGASRRLRRGDPRRRRSRRRLHGARHGGGFDAFGAALVNGTAAHGEDFDDTFEGGPVHSGAVIVPAVLAACEREGLGGDRLLVGIVDGVELLCRLSLVAPTATHKAGFHPTAVFGALAAAGAVGAALRLPPAAIASALGIAGSMASGIIEYLAEGTWTKRMHAGLGRAVGHARGADGTRRVPGTAHGVRRRPRRLSRVRAIGAAGFRPAAGRSRHAMGDGDDRVQALRLRHDGAAVHRLRDQARRRWRASRGHHGDRLRGGGGNRPSPVGTAGHQARPPTPYAAKFSTPFCMAVGFLERKAGLAQFTEARIHDPAVLALGGKDSLCRSIRTTSIRAISPATCARR